LLVGVDSACAGDDFDDLVDDLFWGLGNVNADSGFVNLSFLQIVKLRGQQRRWHVLVSPGGDPCVDQVPFAAG